MREELHMINYLEGGMSEEERNAFEAEMENSPSLKEQVDELRFLLTTIDRIKMLHQVDTVSRWDKMSRKLSLLRFRYKLQKSFQVFAAIAFLPFLFLTAYLGMKFYDTTLYAEELIEIKSANGIVSKIVLPDSSVVFLNSGSLLTYPRSFTEKVRRVSLEGEAYFIVKASPEKRFEVMTSDSLFVTAYGTEFNINAYEGQGWISTVLVEGNVTLNMNEHANIVIKPSQLAVYNKDTRKMNVSDINPYAATAWKDGKIVFRRAKMPEIVYRLSKHFNVDIELKDKLLEQYEFSATFTTETLTEILNLMKKASPIRWSYVEPVQLHDKSFTKRKVIISLMQ